ncbi:MAG: hypothetical protein Q8R28_15035 [Dehalococcoidia bacterium]|nr:hypothetical protein [Dehalococcoidia bacterium]
MGANNYGARVRYCGHDGWFMADIYVIEGASVVRANGPITPGKLNRPGEGATHHLMDYPTPGFWRPDLGMFVVPSRQVLEERD